MNEILDLNLIQEAIENKKIHIFKNPFPDIPEWKTFLSILGKYTAKDLLDYPDKGLLDTKNMDEAYLSFKLRTRFWSRLTFQLYDPKDDLENDIPELIPVLNWARSIYSSRLANSFSLISLVANRGQVGLKHSDYIDQFQWNCIGESIWRTGDNLENEDLINPGDFIFIPKNIQHEIETIKPRAVINLVLHNE